MSRSGALAPPHRKAVTRLISGNSLGFISLLSSGDSVTCLMEYH